MKLRRRVKSARKPHQRMNKKALGTSIDDRIVDARTTIGNWEGDWVKDKRVAIKPAIMTRTYHLTYYEIIVKVLSTITLKPAKTRFKRLSTPMTPTSFIPSLLIMAVNSLC